MTNNAPLITVTNLKKYYTVKKNINKDKTVYLKGVDGVDFKIYDGEILGLVGESGCGKSTLGRSILQLEKITDGSVDFNGTKLETLSKEEMRKMRKEMQMIFQDPYASLNPRMTVFDAVMDSLNAFSIGSKSEKIQMVKDIFVQVGLGEQHYNKYPHEMSGGQRQRVAIARAMVVNPKFIVCDEPVSALDVSVRSQVLNLMKELQQRKKVTYLFVSHDLSVVHYLCDRIMIMYLGNIVESGTKDEIFNHPLHPYTKALLSAIPIADVNVKRNRIMLEGDVPSPINVPTGCKFHPRCPYATEQCSKEFPKTKVIDGTHEVACHHCKEMSKGT